MKSNGPVPFSDDIDLIRRFKGGDRPAFEELLRKYQDRIYNLCRYMLRDAQEAQDAAQDTFLKAYAALKNFKPDASLYTWLYRIGVNTCLDHKRKFRPEPFKDQSPAEDLPISRALTRAALPIERDRSGHPVGPPNNYPRNSRAVIVLKEIEGLSYEEIAEVLKTSIGTVKSRISRAREELRRLLPEN